MTIKVLLALFVAGLLTSPRPRGQAAGGTQDWIAELKKTPVVRMEAGLPDKAFDPWLKELTRSTQPKYELTDCEAAGSGATGMCIAVSADAEPIRRVQLIFAVPSDGAKSSGSGRCTFLRGTVGPSDQRNKQPTRLVRKLSELEAMLK